MLTILSNCRKYYHRKRDPYLVRIFSGWLTDSTLNKSHHESLLHKKKRIQDGACLVRNAIQSFKSSCIPTAKHRTTGGMMDTNFVDY